MPFDGILTKIITNELNEKLRGGRIDKIYQPEGDEIHIMIRQAGQNFRLLLCANPSFPRIHITSKTKDNPALAPTFCMLLRKHLASGRVTSVENIAYERIVSVVVENTSELGDPITRRLVIEIMGKHSNIILLNHENKILDAIKHIDFEISRVREVMPGRPYQLPPQQEKFTIDEISYENLWNTVENSSLRVDKYLLTKVQGFSPILCKSICYTSEIAENTLVNDLTQLEKSSILSQISSLKKNIVNKAINPCVYFSDVGQSEAIDFHALTLMQFMFSKSCETVSDALDYFYHAKDYYERLKQKKFVLQRTITQNFERLHKKLAIYSDNLETCAEKESFQLFGELITANIWQLRHKVSVAHVQNYYSSENEYIDIPLDENLLPQENAQVYFKKFSRAKTTHSTTITMQQEALKEIEYLENVQYALNLASNPDEIEEIRVELINENYISKTNIENGKKKKSQQKSAPHTYLSSDGLTILVGKNNFQNDTLTMKIANSNDIWLHTKEIPGSHVIIRKKEGAIPDSTLHEASVLAAYHSKARMSAQVPVDYTLVKHVKKPPRAKPGMVIYTNFKTIFVTPDFSVIEKISSHLILDK